MLLYNHDKPKKSALFAGDGGGEGVFQETLLNFLLSSARETTSEWKIEFLVENVFTTEGRKYFRDYFQSTTTTA